MSGWSVQLMNIMPKKEATSCIDASKMKVEVSVSVAIRTPVVIGYHINRLSLSWMYIA